MDMQDKELDRLFQQKLDDLEIQPSAGVWQGISSELNADKRKRTLLPLLSAAAGVILLITAGILFIPKQPVKHHDHSTVIVKTHQPVKQPVAVKVEPVVPPAPVQNKVPANPVIAPVNNIAQVNKRNKTKPNLTPSAQQPVVTAQPPATAHADEPLLANAPAADYHVVKTDAPDTATRTSPKSAIINNEKTQPVLIAQTPAQPAPATAKHVKKRRIRSLGDVFNVVIAAVDKRKDKVIEFSNTDEDDATITGLNLGFIKVKKDKDK
ncbi:hypothetical protein MTO98_29060 [Mucilaginibacter sp. SMC90]|uniref:hypothetical protein n=1 Tax=Mucilaginibacter sp. SMC90 TaxID=2929803 RepID=UPI001FB4947E|nr:hypothetical protein [Mucilaginibacter sp. SMC90]UOE48461.1 hypothetical protein MTO98_29060 [Mucilaginibacter sp. SMC90]